MVESGEGEFFHLSIRRSTRVVSEFLQFSANWNEAVWRHGGAAVSSFGFQRNGPKGVRHRYSFSTSALHFVLSINLICCLKVRIPGHLGLWVSNLFELGLKMDTQHVLLTVLTQATPLSRNVEHSDYLTHICCANRQICKSCSTLRLQFPIPIRRMIAFAFPLQLCVLKSRSGVS